MALKAELTIAKLTEGSNPALPDIITRYLGGESLQEISPDYGVATRTLYRWMLGGLGDQNYYQAVSDCLVQRVADADIGLATAADPCQIARAREVARFARMDLERRRPALYGQTNKVQFEHIGDRADELRAAKSRLIEGEVIVDNSDQTVDK